MTANSNDSDRSAVQQAMVSAVHSGAPGIAVEIRDRHGRWFGTAGSSDTDAGSRRRPEERFRIGSTTKAFTAAVVLGLVAEGVLGLDDTVQRWLPGLVRGNGNDGATITVRHLLNQTSGLFNYGNDPAFFANGVGSQWYAHRYDAYTPERLVAVALSHPPVSAPGERFGYSNTNYVLAAMIVEQATGGPFALELERRIIRPLGLTGTSLPGLEPTIDGPHPRHYSTLFSSDPEPEIHDATDMNQSFAWTAGGMISTTGDLLRFFRALLSGGLLPPAQQRELLTFTATDGAGWIPGTRYGLGVFTQELPGGTVLRGNGGATYGSWTYVMGTADGEHLLAAHLNGDWSGLGPFIDVLTAEFAHSDALRR